jgi:transposase InsO family protein
LLDRRHVGGLKQPATFDPRVLEELHAILDHSADKSRVTHQWIYDRLSRRLVGRNAEASEPEELIAVPSLSTFRRKFATIRAELGWDHATKYRRRPAKKVVQQGRFKAQKAGQYVLIDSSPWDVLAWDPVAGRYVALELTIGLDLYTRSIVGFRFTPRTTKGIDAALLLYDIIAPKTLEFGPEASRWPYLGVPEELVIAPPRKEAPAPVLVGVPVVAPDTVVVDRNRIFLSLTFQAACKRLDISIMYARPRRPTDKAHIERVFRTIRDSWLQELPGFRGGSVHDRGRHVEADAVITVEKMRTSFMRWVVECYQYAPHDGLVLPHAPRENVSPNRMYEESLKLWGFTRIPITPNVYFETLPTHFAKITNSGVQRLYLRYDDAILNDFRPAGAKGQARKHPFKYDPRDLSKLFFCHPEHGWHPISWVDAEDPDVPFNDLRLAYAIELTRQRGWQIKDSNRLAETLNGIVAEAVEPKETTLLAQKERVQHAQLRRDRALWRPQIDDADGQDDEMALPEIDELPDDDFGTIEDEDDLIGDAA